MRSVFVVFFSDIFIFNVRLQKCLASNSISPYVLHSSVSFNVSQNRIESQRVGYNA